MHLFIQLLPPDVALHCVMSRALTHGLPGAPICPEDMHRYDLGDEVGVDVEMFLRGVKTT